MFIVAKGTGIQVLDRKTIKGQTLTMTEMEGLEKRKRVDARAASAILRLYSAGALPMMKGRSPEAVPAVETYILSAAAADQEARDAAEQAAAIWQGYLDHPDTVPDTAFSIRLLNAIFMRHAGKGGGTLEIGGTNVTRTTPHRHVSNSGKSSDWSYHFLWKSTDGSEQRLSRESAHAGNRRSDPDRNWGLGRE